MKPRRKTSAEVGTDSPFGKSSLGRELARRDQLKSVLEKFLAAHANGSAISLGKLRDWFCCRPIKNLGMLDRNAKIKRKH